MSLTEPYCILSDLHFHAWSQFSVTNADGVNSRLQIILDEALRAAKELSAQGGDVMFIAGDMFHVRGAVKPSVLNPVMETFQTIDEMGITVYSIAGNHDLEGSDATRLGNAMQALGAIGNFHPVTEPTPIRMSDSFAWLFPWYADINVLREQMKLKACGMGDDLKKTIAIIHAPLNGVLKGIPDHGFSPEELASIGFKHVFVGHYHNHRSFLDGKVMSVGATTHQTWSDPGTKAGYLMVYPDRVEHVLSEAPQFVDVPDDAILHEYPIKGNYVRIRLKDADEPSIKKMRQGLVDAGALGVIVNATKKIEATRASTIKTGSTLAASIAEYVEKDAKTDFKDAVSKAALEILAEAQS